MAAIDSGPAVPFLAGQGSFRAGPDAQSPHLCSANQQAGGAVEGMSLIA